MVVVNTDNMKSDKNNVPQSGFTQRATIDCERDEIYVLSVSRLDRFYEMGPFCELRF